MRTFDNKPLLITIVILFLLKFILCFYSYFLFLLTALIVIFESGWPLALASGVVIACAATFLIFLLILAVNRKGAQAASIALIVFYILDMLPHLIYIFSMPLLAISLLYNLILIMLLTRLRRSRCGAPTAANIDPTQT